MDLKILFVSGTYPPARCGVGDYLYNLVTQLSSANSTKIYVVTSKYLDISLHDCNPFVYPLISNWQNIRETLSKITRIIKSIKPHIIHFQYPTTEYERGVGVSTLPLFIKAKFSELKVVETFHEPLFQYHARPQIKYISALLFSDALIFVDRQYYDLIPWLQRPLFRSKPLKNIPVASNIPNVQLSNRESNNLRKGLDVENSELLIAYFGKITKFKGFESAIEVVEKFKAKFLIISQINGSDPYHSQLLDIFKNKGMNKKIIITGFIPPIEVAKRLHIADVCIFPYVHGVSPKNTSFLAALSQGTFTVATSIRQRGYDSEKNLYFTAPGDIKDMIQAIEKYAEKKIKPNSKLLPTWPSIAREHIELYKNIISK
jgi:glycosyltransferase involved in cell wall biosynthesis